MRAVWHVGQHGGPGLAKLTLDAESYAAIRQADGYLIVDSKVLGSIFLIV